MTRLSIIDLPVEVLLTIFKKVFYAQCTITWRYTLDRCTTECRGPGCSCRFSPDMWNEISDPRRSSLFPYSLCRVSPHWDVVMAGEPEFWTRLIVFLDTTKYDPLARLQAELDRARGLPLSIYVDTTSDNNAPVGADDQRMKKLADILPSLAKRLHVVHIHGPTTVQLARVLERICKGDRQGLAKVQSLSLGSDPRCRNPPPPGFLNLAFAPDFQALKHLHLSGLSVLFAQDTLFDNPALHYRAWPYPKSPRNMGTTIISISPSSLPTSPSLKQASTTPSASTISISPETLMKISQSLESLALLLHSGTSQAWVSPECVPLSLMPFSPPFLQKTALSSSRPSTNVHWTPAQSASPNTAK
ncbi:hypothetical protein BKA70DRAFT_171495 [Coprinopsis sp. MPI-PUGE-AT-0042]|nr:hypothetical protein BKA70DRAFT_171495 [Coprinopsis sp. MPI-PUGE-AT-0042]